MDQQQSPQNQPLYVPPKQPQYLPPQYPYGYPVQPPVKKEPFDPMRAYAWTSLGLSGCGLFFLLFALLGFLLMAGIFSGICGVLALAFGILYLRKKDLKRQGMDPLCAKLGLGFGILVTVLALAAFVCGLVFQAQIDAYFGDFSWLFGESL